MRAKSQPGVAPRRVVAIAMVVVDEDVASTTLLLATALRRHVSRDFGGPFQDGSLVVAMQDLSCVFSSFFLGHRESPPPSILFPLRFSRRGHREHVCFILLVAAENPSPCRICPSLWRLSSPRNPGNSNEGYFTQSTVSKDFAEIPVLDALALFPLASVPRWLSLLLFYSIVQKFSRL